MNVCGPYIYWSLKRCIPQIFYVSDGPSKATKDKTIRK